MNNKAETTKEDALALLDAIRSSGRMEYSDYCALFDAISDISIQPQIQLIPVSERPPKKGKEVLFCDDEGSIYVGHNAIDYWWSVDDKVKKCCRMDASSESV